MKSFFPAFVLPFLTWAMPIAPEALEKVPEVTTPISFSLALNTFMPCLGTPLPTNLKPILLFTVDLSLFK